VGGRGKGAVRGGEDIGASSTSVPLRSRSDEGEVLEGKPSKGFGQKTRNHHYSGNRECAQQKRESGQASGGNQKKTDPKGRSLSRPGEDPKKKIWVSC